METSERLGRNTARQEPENPCIDCNKKETCKLQLSCPHYLKYTLKMQDIREDKKKLRSLLSSVDRASYRPYYLDSKGCPWEKVEGEKDMASNTSNSTAKVQDSKKLPSSEAVDRLTDRINTLFHLQCDFDSNATVDLFNNLACSLIRDYKESIKNSRKGNGEKDGV